MNTQPFDQTGQMIELCCEYLSVQCIWLNIQLIEINFSDCYLHENLKKKKTKTKQNKPAVWTGHDFFGLQNTTQDKKSFVTHPKLMIFWENQKFLKTYDLFFYFWEKKLNLIFGATLAGLVFSKIGS